MRVLCLLLVSLALVAGDDDSESSGKKDSSSGSDKSSIAGGSDSPRTRFLGSQDPLSPAVAGASSLLGGLGGFGVQPTFGNGFGGLGFGNLGFGQFGGFGGLGGVRPVVGGVTPIVSGVSPVVGGVSPVVGGVSPIVGGVSPVVGGVSPIVSGVSPVVGGVPLVAGAGLGSFAAPSSGCRYWCKTPEGAAYCCETTSQPAQPSVVGIVKPGKCPRVRPVCPKSFGPPVTCSNDGACGGVDKCCFDRCLEEHVCKPPRGFRR